MKIVVWLTEGTWEACIDAVRDQPATSIELLHVIDPESLDALAGARASLLGRGFAADTGPLADNLKAAQQALLDAAQARLGRPTGRQARWGRPEREVVAACASGGMLILARDGDRTRLGPRSIGHTTRFILDHAPCRVLLIWPDEPPRLSTLPPPPPHGAGHPSPPPAS
jgi:nucleotide-binding universal stress UspA family protein